MEFEYLFLGTPSIKHLVEALHVPHTEVGEILVDGQPANQSHLVADSQCIVVFPLSNHTPDKTIVSPLSEDGRPRFVLDNHLGKLAVYLRMLGFDALYRNNYQDNELARISVEENRILLTRDRGLLMRRVIINGYFIRKMDPKKQIVEVIDRFELADKILPFRRCLVCNTLLQYVEKEAILERLEPLTRQYYNEFHKCTTCDQIYWKGSHYSRMMSFMKGFLDSDL